MSFSLRKLLFLRGAAEVLEGCMTWREAMVHPMGLPLLEPREAFLLCYLIKLLCTKICVIPRKHI